MCISVCCFFVKMCLWEPVLEAKCYGIVIYNFNEEEEGKLKLVVGDTVHLLEQEENWYYGCVIDSRQNKGIFPKSYIHVKPCHVDLSGPIPNFILKEPPIAQEITSVLREWGSHWKNLYVDHDKRFEQIKTQIYDLINHRSKIMSGTLPVDEMKTVTKQATEEIDMGNKILGLDLVVRDKNGNIINPEDTSTMQLYYYHKRATERMDKQNKSEQPKEMQPKTAIQQYSNIFLVAVKNFTCKMSEDAELLMTLYDGKEYKAITENYVVRWSKDGLMSDLDQMHNLRVMFTDLGKKDLEREKIYLVCYVVRVGTMETKEVDHRRSSSVSNASHKKSLTENMRRPLGVAAMDVKPFMDGRRDSDLEQEFPVPFVSCEKDTLEQTLRKIISKQDLSRNDGKNQALFVSMKLLRGDVKQVREENPHLVLGNVSIARKMGFPEVILPGDIRNDLYLTLVSGEFSKGNKKTEKNVEVVVRVCNESGEAIPGVISIGGGVQPLNEYKSVIYYHDDKPQWHETFKVAIPIEEFKNSHLKFTFKHRSSNEAKDKSEKPFAMSFVRLMEQNGTTLRDSRHSLAVYKTDYKKFDEKSMDYFQLPSKDDEIKDLNNKVQVAGLTLSTKDSFIISSNICSTKLTQNVDLLSLLNWASHKESLEDTLKALLAVDGEEVVKLLQDILDALFNILMDNSDKDCNKLIFECLLYIIGLVSNDWKYQHFEPVLDLYISEGFSATLAYKKLISVLIPIIKETSKEALDTKLLFKTMKSLQYVMRFISRSRILYLEVNPEDDPMDDFAKSVKDLLHNIIHMMSSTSDYILREQGACLKYLPSTIPDLLLVFDPKILSDMLCFMLQKIPSGRLTKQKMMTVNDIVHSKLFLLPECRRIMLPVFTDFIKILFETNEEALGSRQDGRRQNRSVAKVAQLLGTTQHRLNQHRGYSEEVELCIKILSDILELLFRKDVGPTHDDMKEIITKDLRTVIQSHIHMPKENPHAGNLVAIMMDIFRQMSENHYENYIQKFSTAIDVLDFLMEILLVFKELVGHSVFPPDWCDMIMLQNCIILKALRFFSHTIRDRFFTKFEYQAWNNFFHCAIAFMTQPALQLENFSHNKRIRLIKLYKDMRRETGFEIRSMWFNLGQYKVQFVPGLVESILEMTLIPEPELRKATIPIFFDMMQCEYYSSKYIVDSYGDTKRDSSHVKGNFEQFENEMIMKLDQLVEGGRGDVEYKNLFNSILKELSNQHTVIKEHGLKFVDTVTQLLERLLEYRCIIKSENKENKMSCTVNLLDYYDKIKRQKMYIRYLDKLYNLHIECDNYTEAAFTLELHSKLLKWSDEELPILLRSNRYSNHHTHRQLKEAIYYNIIANYDKGKMWECAIQKCQELAKQYEEEIYDYEKLSDLHKKLASFYDDIVRKVRLAPEYFRVGYYGRGFPQFLQNKVFIYRGKEYERLADFNSRILNEFPKAELLNFLTPPGEDITESDKQYVQINHVAPIMEEKRHRFSGKPISEQILNYYKVNNIKKFTFSRPYHYKDPLIETNNEFASLWLERTILTTTYPLPGILRWFPVCDTEVYKISPLVNAIEVMEKTNKILHNLIMTYNREKTMSLNSLSLRLNGILDPAVMGGIKNYEEVFFTESYITHHPDDLELIEKLKTLIANQIPLLELCVQLHRERASASMLGLQTRLEECFLKMQENVVEKYGKGVCDIRLDPPVTMRRQATLSTSESLSSELSNAVDNMGGRSRVSSLTRNQVNSLKQFTANFNFSNASPSVNSKLNHATRSMLSPSKSASTTPSLGHKKSHKLHKEKRRSSKSELSSLNISIPSATQWYTSDTDSSINAVNSNGSTTPIFELTEELTPKRPLRSEIEREKRLSRPPSGQFSRPNSISVSLRGTGSSENSSNRDSVGTTDSSISEEDPVPPPLPVKTREADYCNLPAAPENTSFLYSNRSSIRNTLCIKVPVADLEDTEKDIPPTPPPKPPRNKNNNDPF